MPRNRKLKRRDGNLTAKERAAHRQQALNHLKEQQEVLNKIDTAVNEIEIKKQAKAMDVADDNPDSAKNKRAEKSERELTHKPLSHIMQPKHVAAARRKAYNLVMNNMDRAAEVLSGHRKWSNQQVNLFGKMLNKVIPDLHHSVADVNHNITGNINEIPLEDLMKIAMDDANVIEGEADTFYESTRAPEYTEEDYANDPDLVRPKVPTTPKEPSEPRPSFGSNEEYDNPLEDLDFVALEEGEPKQVIRQDKRLKDKKFRRF